MNPNEPPERPSPERTDEPAPISEEVVISDVYDVAEPEGPPVRPISTTVRPPGPSLPARPNRPRGERGAPTPARPVDALTGIPVPSLRGHLLRLLAETKPRVGATDDALTYHPDGPDIVLETGEQRGAVALACVLLENLRRVGGSRVPVRGIEGVLERVLPTLSTRELMELEIEAYDTLEWIARTLKPDLEEPRVEVAPAGPEVVYDPDMPAVELIQRGIRERFDLTMLYYTGSRGELMTRRVSPRRIEAEKFLYAYCHTREEDRVFRLSRIARVEPVGGRAVTRTQARPAPAKPGKGVAQRGLFDGEE